MIIVLPLQDLKNKMWVLWYWSKFLSFEEKATFVISCQTFWGYLPNLVATEDDASQPLNLKSFFRIVSVKFVVFFFNCTLCFSDFYSTGWLPWKFLHLQFRISPPSCTPKTLKLTRDQYQYLGNCPPTPPPTQHQP